MILRLVLALVACAIQLISPSQCSSCCPPSAGPIFILQAVKSSNNPLSIRFCKPQTVFVAPGVVSLQGHVFCFTCIHLWVKTNSKCPNCRVNFKKITKTLTNEDIAKEKARTEVLLLLRLQLFVLSIPNAIPPP